MTQNVLRPLRLAHIHKDLARVRRTRRSRPPAIMLPSPWVTTTVIQL